MLGWSITRWPAVEREVGAGTGYVSVTTGSIRREDAPGATVQPLGSRLLAEALHRAVAASDAAAARLVVVDAIDGDATAFYRRWGFIEVPENPLRLLRNMADVRRSLEDA